MADIAIGDWSKARDTLLEWRSGNERKSSDVIEIAKWLLPKYASNLGSDGSAILVGAELIIIQQCIAFTNKSAQLRLTATREPFGRFGI
jgi:hypothetical protein